MSWQIKKMPDSEYFKAGDIFREMIPVEANDQLIVSNSFLKDVRKYNLFHLLKSGKPEIDEETQSIFDVGSAFHCAVLEPAEFDNRYYISNTPDPTIQKTRVSKSDGKWIKEVTRNIQDKYPKVADRAYSEIAIFGEIDDVPVKAKIDKLIVGYSGNSYSNIEIVDLKSTYFDPFKFKKDPSGDRKKLRWMLSDIDYDLQAFFYTKLVEEWAKSLGAYCPVDFSLLVASKETAAVQKFRVGAEMMETGRLKFESVWGDVRDFVLHGKDRLLKEEVL